MACFVLVAVVASPPADPAQRIFDSGLDLGRNFPVCTTSPAPSRPYSHGFPPPIASYALHVARVAVAAMLSRTNRKAVAGPAWAAAASTIPPNHAMAMTAGWAMVEAAEFGLAADAARFNKHSERATAARQTLASGGKLMWDGYMMLPGAHRLAGLGVALEACKALRWGSDDVSDAVEALTAVLTDRPESFEALQMLAEALDNEVREHARASCTHPCNGCCLRNGWSKLCTYMPPPPSRRLL